MKYIHHVPSPIGELTLVAEEDKLTEIRFNNAGSPAGETKEEKIPVLAETEKWLEIYFTGKDPGFCPEMEMKGSDFQKSVWKHIEEIPFGQTVTYGQIARKIAEERGMNRMAAQAVGGAVGSNPIPIIVPCHRVMGSGGKLTGYGGGIDKKVILLGIEGCGTDFS